MGRPRESKNKLKEFSENNSSSDQNEMESPQNGSKLKRKISDKIAVEKNKKCKIVEPDEHDFTDASYSDDEETADLLKFA